VCARWAPGDDSDSLAGFQVEGERGFLVGEHVPALAVEFLAADGGDGEAFIGEFFRLPGSAVDTPGEEGAMAGEKEQAMFEQRANLEDGAESDHGETGGVGGVDQVGVAAGHNADVDGIGRGPETCGDLRGEETESAGGQEGLGVLVRMNEDFEGALLHFFGVKRVAEVLLGQDERTGWEDFGSPAVRKAQVDDVIFHGKIRWRGTWIEG
jgi:hypothetical protein